MNVIKRIADFYVSVFEFTYDSVGLLKTGMAKTALAVLLGPALCK